MPDIADVAWSERDDRNSEAVPEGWPQGTMPAYVDQTGRMMMAATKRFWNKINPTYQTSGPGDAYVVQTEASVDHLNLFEFLTFRIDRSNVGTTPTLQIGSTNPRTIVKAGPSGYVPLAAGDMFAGNDHTFWYNGAFYILSDPALIVGSTVQPYSANLTAWSAVNPSSYSTTAQIAATYLTTAAAAAAYQPLDPDLTAWAAVNPSAYLNTAGIAAAYQPLDADLTAIAALTTTPTGRALLTIANAAAGFDSLSPTTTRGDLIFRNGTTNTRLAASTAGYHLQTNGPATDPTWTGFFQPLSGTPAIRTWNSKASDRADLRDWNGLDLTGATDMATLVQAAVNATAAAGVKLNAPAGQITLGSKITVPEGANIEGSGLPADRNGTFSAYNTYFHLAHSDFGFQCAGVALAPGNSSGPARRLAGFGTYRDHPTIAPGWAPTAASADIQITGVYEVLVEDIFFYNANRALGISGDTGTNYGCGRLTLRRLRGQPMLYGLNVGSVYDTIYIDDVHWWPYWSFDSNVLAYMKANGVAALFGRADWPQVGRIFSWGMKYGLRVINQATVGSLPGGTTTAMHIDSLNADNCETGLLVDQSANGATVSIDHLYATNTVYAASPIVQVDSSASNATGSVALQISMPYAAKKVGAGGVGYVGGNMIKGIIQSSVARLDITTYSGVYPVADGSVVRISGQYEIA